MIKLTIPKEVEQTEEIKKWKSETERILSKKMEEVFNTSEFKEMQDIIMSELACFGESKTLVKFKNGEITLECLK